MQLWFWTNTQPRQVDTVALELKQRASRKSAASAARGTCHDKQARCARFTPSSPPEADTAVSIAPLPACRVAPPRTPRDFPSSTCCVMRARSDRGVVVVWHKGRSHLALEAGHVVHALLLDLRVGLLRLELEVAEVL